MIASRKIPTTKQVGPDMDVDMDMGKVVQWSAWIGKHESDVELCHTSLCS